MARHLPLAVSADAPATQPVEEEGVFRGDGAEAALLQVGDLAKATGKTVRAIHLYEELGLLQPSKRSKGRFRLFDADAVARVRWVSKLQDLGMTLPEIQAIARSLSEASSAPGAMKVLRETYRARIDETRAQLRRLHALERELSASLAYLDTCDSCDPSRVLESCAVCDQHSCHGQAPELVRSVQPRTKLGPAHTPDDQKP